MGQLLGFAGNEFTVSGLVSTDYVSGVSLSSAGQVANAAAGSYAINITNAAGDAGLTNYQITYVPGTLSVGQAGLGVSANSTNRMYGAANPVFTVSYNGFVNGDTAGVLGGALVVSSAADTNSPVGTYPIVASGLTASNYVFSYTNGVLEVTNAPLTVSANDTNKTYGQTVTFAGTEFSSSGLLNGDTVSSVTLSSSGAEAAASVAGSPYDINVTNASGSGLTNYTINYVDGQLTVNAAGLAVVVNNTNRLYGAANPVFTVSYAGFVNEDTASVLSGVPGLTTEATTNSPVGSYTITNTMGTLSATNYALSFTNGTLTVNPAILTVSADDKTRMFTLTNPVLTASFNGFVNNEDTNVLDGGPALSTAANPDSPVGDYPITIAQGTLSNANYSFDFLEGTLTVTPAPAPVITVIGLTNGAANITWTSFAGGTYQVQYNDSLDGSNWIDWIPDIMATGSNTLQTNILANVSQRFFRWSYGHHEWPLRPVSKV